MYPAPFAVKLNKNNQTIAEPDISVICDQNKLTDRGCTGAPDWIIEIVSPSNASHDYIRKLNLYADAGVREYWIVDPARERFFDKSKKLVYNKIIFYYRRVFSFINPLHVRKGEENYVY